jgi:hypothetical protein
MASILLATTNRDKSQILQDLIQDIFPERSWVFSNLSTYKNLPDCPETGDMTERAIQKVQFYTNVLHPLDDYIV